ncbi:hypothetical protein SK128_025852 [Halocaridina rubra]|uniref:Uncharacterized protein n=1 Tax=Halocaridina rubra TaxID=373956 RepID=A0AAN8WQ35_HALRR
MMKLQYQKIPYQGEGTAQEYWVKRKRYGGGGRKHAKRGRTSSPSKSSQGSHRGTAARARPRAGKAARGSKSNSFGNAAPSVSSTVGGRGSSSFRGARRENSGPSRLQMLSLPTPRSFLPPPKVMKL